MGGCQPAATRQGSGRVHHEGNTGTRVFKNSSPNCKLKVYFGKWDFVDHQDKVDPVDGMVLVDPDYLKDRKVFATLTYTFRYGHEDLDIIIPQNLPCSVTLQPGPEDTG